MTDQYDAAKEGNLISNLRRAVSTCTACMSASVYNMKSLQYVCSLSIINLLIEEILIGGPGSVPPLGRA